MIAFTEQLALHSGPYGIRANCILPGLMDTPMAVDTRARTSNGSRAEVAAERDAGPPARAAAERGLRTNFALALRKEGRAHCCGRPRGTFSAGLEQADPT